ncbi:MAG: glucose-1-phosphate thymidylyltransferase [Deltaproteobacteria bacterium]|jgi:NDP-sugar pyrophosphorylase family protein|nr:glucose-1-phosphate thymidylyltransferase [Deltaproteobacteria bacterium]
MSWFEAKDYFSLSKEEELESLFSASNMVWDILDLLEGFIRDSIKPNVSALLAEGPLMTKAAALIEGEAIFGVEWEEDNGLKVFKEGHLIEGAALVMPGAYIAGDSIEIKRGAIIEPGAMLKGPTIIGEETEVRQGAYVRGSVLSFKGCVIGHATEAKNLLMLEGAKAGHFAYLGDSLLGGDVNLGAGTKLANLKMVQAPFRFKAGGETIEVKRRKFGAVLGDKVETGCNSVTSPGVLMGPGSKLLPNVTAKGGYYPPRSLIH